MAQPVWKDKHYTLGTGDVYIYRVRLNNSSGTVIYTGRAYKRPGASNVVICINDIISGLFKQTPGPMSVPAYLDTNFTAAPDIVKTIYFEKSTDGVTFTEVATAEPFYFDRSYDPSRDINYYRWHDPITGEISNAQLLWLTESDDHMFIKVINVDGQTATELSLGNLEVGNLALPLSRYPNAAIVQTIDGPNGHLIRTNYKVLHDCFEFALYYVNAFGGWDTLLIKGRVKVTDNYTRRNIGLEYNNSDISNRGTENYANEVARVFTINTGWLPGDAGKKMHHLLGSTMVYLYDFNDDQFIPVTIDDTTCEYKSYRSEGDRPVNFTITATEAHDMKR